LLSVMWREPPQDDVHESHDEDQGEDPNQHRREVAHTQILSAGLHCNHIVPFTRVGYAGVPGPCIRIRDGRRPVQTHAPTDS
jgi:hypothetical protein